jgi:hypothetical protein
MLGFILTPTYRVVRGVPEVHLYGVLESGEPCLITDDRTRPHFFVLQRDVERLRSVAPGLRAEPGSLSDPAVRSDPTRPPEASGVRAGSGPAERTPGAAPIGLRSLDGEAVATISVGVPGDVPPLRDRLENQGIRCLEAGGRRIGSRS